jgi:hypothetical protein
VSDWSYIGIGWEFELEEGVDSWLGRWLDLVLEKGARTDLVT